MKSPKYKTGVAVREHDFVKIIGKEYDFGFVRMTGDSVIDSETREFCALVDLCGIEFKRHKVTNIVLNEQRAWRRVRVSALRLIARENKHGRKV